MSTQIPEQLTHENHVTKYFLLILVVLSFIVLAQHISLYLKLNCLTNSAIQHSDLWISWQRASRKPRAGVAGRTHYAGIHCIAPVGLERCD